MSETKFTEGEWFVDSTYTTFLQVSSAHGVPLCEVGSEYDYTNSRIDPTGEQIANAHLIAAAPEMYSELSDILPDYACACRYDSCRVCKQRKSIERMLAKARGEL